MLLQTPCQRWRGSAYIQRIRERVYSDMLPGPDEGPPRVASKPKGDDANKPPREVPEEAK